MSFDMIYSWEITSRVEAPEFVAIRGSNRMDLAVRSSDKDGSRYRAARRGIGLAASRWGQTSLPNYLARGQLQAGHRTRHQSHVELLLVRRTPPNQVGVARS